MEVDAPAPSAEKRRSSVGAKTPVKEVEAVEETAAPVSVTKSRRSSAGSTGRRSSTGSKTPAKEVEADDETE
eukprot:2155542-Rhodomonas_salina.1